MSISSYSCLLHCTGRRGNVHHLNCEALHNWEGGWIPMLSLLRRKSRPAPVPLRLFAGARSRWDFALRLARLGEAIVATRCVLQEQP